MATVYTKNVINTALSEVGYKADGKYNKYAKTLDAINYYNTKKNGYANFCAIFYDYCVYMNTDPQTADATRAIVYEPNSASANAGAGCTQKVSYYKSHNAYYTKKADACKGDEIFFKKSDGTIYHTGIVVDWDKNGFYTVEANTDGGRTEKKYYKYSDARIAGFGRPQFTAWEKPEPTPEPTPTPTPEPTPTGGVYMFDVSVVKQGTSGADTLLLQRILYSMGFKGADGKPLALDGNCGKNTVHAINACQTYLRKQGIEVGTNKKNDSKCGAKMWKALLNT